MWEQAVFSKMCIEVDGFSSPACFGQRASKRPGSNPICQDLFFFILQGRCILPVLRRDLQEKTRIQILKGYSKWEGLITFG